MPDQYHKELGDIYEKLLKNPQPLGAVMAPDFMAAMLKSGVRATSLSDILQNQLMKSAGDNPEPLTPLTGLPEKEFPIGFKGNRRRAERQIETRERARLEDYIKSQGVVPTPVNTYRK